MAKLLALQARPRDPFALWIRDNRPDLRVPEGDITLVEGCGGWSHWHESPAPASPCPKCGDGIAPGSRLYCPKCHRSGFDAKLAEQRRIAPPPPRRARAPARPAAKSTRKARRKSAAG